MDFQPLMEKLVAVPLRGDKRNSTNNDDYNDVPNQYRLIVRLRLALGYCHPTSTAKIRIIFYFFSAMFAKHITILYCFTSSNFAGLWISMICPSSMVTVSDSPMPRSFT